jgi:aspartate aminotransferase
MGFTYIPPELGNRLFQGVIGVASETYSCAASPIQIAATVAYEEKDLAKAFLHKQITLLSQVSNYCTEKLNQASIRVHPCVGGFYLFPDFSAFKEQLNARNIVNSADLTSTIMDEAGVALLPGSAFGMPEQSLTARLAFVDFEGKQILNSTNKADYRQVKKGIDKLCVWAKEL